MGPTAPEGTISKLVPVGEQVCWVSRSSFCRLMNPAVFFQLQPDGPPHLRSSRMDLGLRARNQALGCLQTRDTEPADPTGTGSPFLLHSPRQQKPGGPGAGRLDTNLAPDQTRTGLRVRQESSSRCSHSHQLFDFLLLFSQSTRGGGSLPAVATSRGPRCHYTLESRLGDPHTHPGTFIFEDFHRHNTFPNP